MYTKGVEDWYLSVYVYVPKSYNAPILCLSRASPLKGVVEVDRLGLLLRADLTVQTAVGRAAPVVVVAQPDAVAPDVAVKVLLAAVDLDVVLLVGAELVQGDVGPVLSVLRPHY